MTEPKKRSQSINKLYVEIIEHGCKTVCFTSVGFNEGITIIATETAETAASYGRRVLYCDFGNYNTSLSKRWNIEMKASEDHLVGLVTNRIQFIESLGFDIVSLPGPRPPDTSLIKKESLELFFNELKKKYDLIFIDAHGYNKYQPHTLPTRMLCEVADSSVLIIMSGESTLTEVKETTNELVESGAKLLGFVMNDLHYPRLVDELCKQSLRIDKFFPKLGALIRKKLRESVVLNIEL